MCLFALAKCQYLFLSSRHDSFLSYCAAPDAAQSSGPIYRILERANLAKCAHVLRTARPTPAPMSSRVIAMQISVRTNSSHFRPRLDPSCGGVKCGQGAFFEHSHFELGARIGARSCRRAPEALYALSTRANKDVVGSSSREMIVDANCAPSSISP